MNFNTYTQLILTLGMLSILSPSFAATSDELADFKAYQQSQNKKFKKYITDQHAAFKLYKKTYQHAFSHYKSNIKKVWAKTDVSSAKRWVSYSDDFKQKTVIDYPKGTVTVTSVMDKNQSISEAKKSLEKELTSLNKLTYQQAYKQDPVGQAVDKTMRQQVAPNLFKTFKASDKSVPIFNKIPAKEDIKVSTPRKLGKYTVISATYTLKKQDVNYRIKKLLPVVMAEAKIQKISPALILAIVKNESAFNPLARSHIPAYGLMQIVPHSAGKDATQYLFGEQKLLSSSYLYTPKKNIKIGAAYLHILNYNYLRRIKNPQSRIYCVISAYNTGAGNVSKAFTGNYSLTQSARVINTKTPKQVYNHLQSHLPYDETKHYLKKVNNSYLKYSTLFTQ